MLLKRIYFSNEQSLASGVDPINNIVGCHSSWEVWCVTYILIGKLWSNGPRAQTVSSFHYFDIQEEQQFFKTENHDTNGSFFPRLKTLKDNVKRLGYIGRSICDVVLMHGPLASQIGHFMMDNFLVVASKLLEKGICK